jgi:hypothetical protein
MKKIFQIPYKGKIAILLLALGAIELFSCTTFNNNIAEMGNSFSEVYSDRVVAQYQLYQLADKIHERKLRILDQANIHNEFKYGLASETHAIIDDYEKTKFTVQETDIYREFKGSLQSISILEKKYLIAESPLVKSNLLNEYNQLLSGSLAQLDELSQIQLARAGNLNEGSKKIVSLSSLLNQFDYILVIAILIAIHALIFASRSTIPKFNQKHSLN